MLKTTSQDFISTFERRPELKEYRDNMGQIAAATVQSIGRKTFESAQGEPTVKKTLSTLYASTCFELLSKLAATKPGVAKNLKTLITSNSFYNGCLPAEHFEFVSRYNFRIKPGTVPSVALEALTNGTGLAILDCNMVSQIGEYQAIYKTLKKEKFDKLFSHETGEPFTLSSYEKLENPLLVFLQAFKPEKREKGNREIAVGQRVCFDNIPLYKEKHLLLGEASSYSVICCEDKKGQQRYVGHGLLPEGMSEDQVEQIMIDEYNELPMSAEALTDDLVKKLMPLGKELERARCKLLAEPTEENHRKVCDILKTKHPEGLAKSTADQIRRQARPITREDIVEEFGYKEALVIDFRIDLIHELANKDIKNVSMDFVRKKLMNLPKVRQ